MPLDDENMDLEDTSNSENNNSDRDQYTTPEAISEAQQLIKDYRGQNNSPEKSDLVRRLNDQASEARKVLSDARQRILNRQYDKRIQQRAWSQALLHSGAGNFIGELSDANAATIPYLRDQQTFNLQRENDLGNVESALANADSGSLKAAQALYELQSKQKASLASQALKVLGREIRPQGAAATSGKDLSQFGKQARDMGYTPGTPEYGAVVKRMVEADMANKRATAGLDIDEPNQQDTSQLAYDLGIPSVAPDPYKGYGTKERQRRMKDAQKAGQSYLDKLNANVELNNTAIQQAQRMAQLNESVNTSAALGAAKDLSIPVGIPGVVHGDLGKTAGQLIYNLSGLTPQAREMDKIQGDLARSKRLPGERFTNYDQQMLQSIVPGRDKPYLTNKNLITAIIQSKQLANDHIRFLNDYFQAHGHLMGAEAYWDQYLKDNPIFDSSKSKIPTDSVKNNGVYILNKDRLSYPDYFRKKSNTGAGKGKAPMATPGAAGSTGYYGNDDSTPRFAEGGQVDPFLVSKPSYLTGMLGEVGQGASLGFGDELLGEPGHDRARLESFSNENPLSTIAGQGAGAAATTLAALAALSRISKSNTKLGNVARTLIALSGRYPKASRTALGATVGGLAGAGSGDDRTGTLAPAMNGAILGALMSPLGSQAGKYLYRAGKRLTPGNAPISEAERRVIQALGDNQTTLSQLPGGLNRDIKSSIPSQVADLGGEQMENLTQNVLRHPGDDTRALGQQIQARQDASRSRVMDQVNRALKPDPYFSQLDKLTSSLYENSRPLYEKAYASTPEVTSKAFDRLSQTDQGKAAIKYAQDRMQLDLSKAGVTKSAKPLEQLQQAQSQEDIDRIAQSLGLFGDEINPDIQKLENFYLSQREKLPSMGESHEAPKTNSLEFLDYVKKGMDSQITKAYRAGDDNLARLLQDHRNSLRDELDQVSPLYKDARGQYAGDLEVLDALKTGREGFDSLAPDQVAKLTGQMSFAEKDALRTGVAQRLFEKISNPTSDVNYAQKIVGSPAMMAKLSHVFDKPSEFNAFQAALQREAELYDTSAKALSSAKKSNGALVLPGHGSILSKVWGLINRPGGMSDELANSVAKILSESDPIKVKELSTKLQNTSTQMAKRKAGEELGKAAGVAGVAAATMPSPRGYTDAESGEDQ